MIDYARAVLGARTARMGESGASAVEYGLLIAGVAALIVVTVLAFGDTLTGVFKDTCSKVSGSTSAGCSS